MSSIAFRSVATILMAGQIAVGLIGLDYSTALGYRTQLEYFTRILGLYPGSIKQMHSLF